MSDAYLSIERLTLSYGGVVAVPDLDLTVDAGSLTALLGPSGCGKSTTMRAVAGLMTPDSGRIVLDGSNITHMSPGKRPVGMVFQSYALFPHLTVFDNVAFGLKLAGIGGGELRARVGEALESVGLTAFADRLPADLSGGQQQRVAMARSLVVRPKLLLLDEPLSNLDARLRIDLRAELQRIQSETGMTMLYVTHDQEEAMALADKVVVMNQGRIEQAGTPEEIWNAPRTGFTARFIGFENIFALDHPGLAAGTREDGAVGLAWRPSAVTVGSGPYRGQVTTSAFHGDRVSYRIESGLGPVQAIVPADLPRVRPGADLDFDLPAAQAAPLMAL